MGKKIRRLGLILGLLLLLSGCLSQSGEDFYALPQLPQDYLTLQNTIDQVMDELKAEYAAPTAGTNTQNIQLQDLDSDGKRESAVAFFRVPSAEKPLKIYVFRQNQVSEEYETAWVIEGEGTGIYSVAFENLGGGAEKEVVVSWQISAKVQSVTAYALQRGGNAVEMMRSGYTKCSVTDIDRDNEKELILVQLDTVENNSSAELYDYDSGLMMLKSKVLLSMNITNIQTVKVGSLTNMAPALFVSSDFLGNGGQITDILTMKNGALYNLSVDEASGMSLSTIRYYKDFKDAGGVDINNDGVLEFPLPEPLPIVGESGSQMYLLHWLQYDPEGNMSRVFTTFHNYTDGWYLILPDEWQGKVTVARRDSTGSIAGSERAVSFYHYISEQEEIATEEFLTIYRLTGSNRANRAKLDGRFVLFESSDVIYAAKFRETEWDCGLNGDELLVRFNRVRVDWSEN